MLDKDGINRLDTIEVGHHYYIQKPIAEEYRDCCNEFWWLSTYTAKGLCREELMYAKSFMERYEMDKLFKMCEFLHELASNVAEHFDFEYCRTEAENVMVYLKEMKK